MINAKDEFLEEVDGKEVKCALVEHFNGNFSLVVGYSEEDLSRFLSELDFNYDDGFGGQELYGTIWYEHGTWSERGEYDGSEWWNHCRVPDIPESLNEGVQ